MCKQQLEEELLVKGCLKQFYRNSWYPLLFAFTWNHRTESRAESHGVTELRAVQTYRVTEPRAM